MKIVEVNDYPSIPRRVIYVVNNPDSPRVLHADGNPHPDDEPEPWKTCKECRGNWEYVGRDRSEVKAAENIVNGWEWNGEELRVFLNQFGNPVHDEQEIVSTRAKTWDELYNEVDQQMGEHVTFGRAPREAAPALLDETEPDFALIPNGEPYMEEDMAKQRFNVLRLGIPQFRFIAEGGNNAGFVADRDAKFAESKDQILATEQSQADALAIVGV